METSQVVALALFLAVYALAATGWVHRAGAALVGAVVALAVWGLPIASHYILPEVLLVTAGLMAIGGAVRRSGMASWLALKAAKIGRGRPSRILVLMGILTWLTGALLGPVAAVTLVVPVTLLLAVELDVSPLPFVVVLTWTSLLGAATTLTALPGNLWLGVSLGLDAGNWTAHLLPYTTVALVVTLLTGSLIFGKQLRVTNERRARVLEYDASLSLESRPIVVKTAVVVVAVVVGLALGPWLGVAASLVTVAGAVLLWLMEAPKTVDNLVRDIDAGTLLFFAGLFVVMGAVAASGVASLANLPPPHPLALLWLSALLSTFWDQGAVAGLSVPALQAWSSPAGNTDWVFVALGTTLGGGASVLGSLAGAASLSLAGQGARRVTWRQFTVYGLILAAINGAVISLMIVFLG